MRGPKASGGGRTFADFYYRNVAISEGCGCSELVIRDRDPKLRPLGLWPWLKARLRRISKGKAS